MARKPRVHFPGALYHVIVWRNKGQRVFRREADFKLYLRLLGEYKEVFDFVLCAYALMPTHVHLLVEARDKPLSGLMQRVQHLAGAGAAGVIIVSNTICIWRQWRGFQCPCGGHKA